MTSAENPASPNNNSEMPCILFLGRDIFFAPVIKSAAQIAGLQFVMLASADAALPADRSGDVQACVVDLTPLSAEQITQWGQKLSERFPAARRIAFGPHVNVDLFATAAAAGFAPVLAKGQVKPAAFAELLRS